MDEAFICAGCNGVDFVKTGSDEFFVFYICKNCGRSKQVRCVEKPKETVNIDQLIKELSVTLHHWKSQDRRDEYLREIENDRRHLESRLDAIRNSIRLAERLEDSPKKARELSDLWRNEYDLLAKCHENFIDHIQSTSDLNFQLRFSKEAIENVKKQISVISNCSYETLHSEKLNQKLLERMKQLKRLRLEIESTLILRNFPVLYKESTIQNSVKEWDKLREELNNALVKLRNEFPPSEARSLVEQKFFSRREEVMKIREAIRRNQLIKLLSTKLYEPLPDSLGELEKEIEAIDRDIHKMKEIHDPQAELINERLQNRRKKVVNKIANIRLKQDVASTWNQTRQWVKDIVEKVRRKLE